MEASSFILPIVGLFEQITDSARNFACALHKSKPGALIPNPIDDGLEMAWDKLCGDPPRDPANLPPPPSIPFKGGQCAGVLYSVTVDATQERGILAQGLGFINIPGPIHSIEPLSIPTNGGTEGAIRIRYADTSQTKTFTNCNSGGGGIFCGFTSVQNIRIARQDGLADNCGDPPKSYPPTSPPPPDGFNSPLTPIVLNNTNVINVTFNLKPPLPLPLPGVPPVIVVNVKSPDLNFPIEFNFNGEINIGGSSPPVTLPPDIVDRLTRIEDKVNNSGDTVTNINNNFNDYRKDYDYLISPPGLKDDPSTKKKPIAEGDKGEDDVEGLVGVLVELTKLPDKAQFGTPNIYFAGWFSYFLQGGYEERRQINYEKSYFTAPPGAVRYAFTLTNGARGKAISYSKEKAPS